MSDKIKGHVATYLNVTTMRVAARAYRPRVASTAYGRAVRLPSDRPIPRCTETPYFAGPRYCWDDAKIYDLSIPRGVLPDISRITGGRNFSFLCRNIPFFWIAIISGDPYLMVDNIKRGILIGEEWRRLHSPHVIKKWTSTTMMKTPPTE